MGMPVYLFYTKIRPCPLLLGTARLLRKDEQNSDPISHSGTNERRALFTKLQEAITVRTAVYDRCSLAPNGFVGSHGELL